MLLATHLLPISSFNFNCLGFHGAHEKDRAFQTEPYRRMWKMSGMHSYNPEQIMLSPVVRRPSRDVNLMKEKLIFSGKMWHKNGVGRTDELSAYTGNGLGAYARDDIMTPARHATKL
ncbi:Glycerophosphodiester phosphodiesterase domain-containing protein 5 [Labeo rohita]|uniref:Glycerophosphodiester phosphodiesterase domain-containing protein 5 n=1 Tax=Labeo rohita TaxID=84645 RepID=A0ABQ8MU66_LABRO|nr:Glycerophosphodiester phosphodiesterase domain-containing protein 5 [Labeo rohita]